MKIGIDARFLTHPQPGGFKTYSENLIRALAESDEENEYIFYVDRPLQSTFALPLRANCSVCVIAGQRPLVGMFWREQVALARQAAHDRLDLFHAPNLTAPLALACPLVLTIHDMIWFAPEQFAQQRSRSVKRTLMAWYYRLVPYLAARRAALILTVSYAAKASIVDKLDIKADRIVVTYEAASPIYQPIGEPVRLTYIRHKYKLATEFILALGSADPRKNMATLLAAFAHLPAAVRERYHLSIIWTHPFLSAEIAAQVQQLGLTEQVQFLEDVPTADLALLYNAATLFAFPSRYEGFGLPLLEAMACGTPVVAADNSSIPEVAGDAALLFPADDPDLMATCIERVLSEPDLYATLRHKGLQRAAQFSWGSCAQQTLAAYRHSLLRREKRWGERATTTRGTPDRKGV